MPSGPWQARYDGILLFGVAFSVGSIIAVRYSSTLHCHDVTRHDLPVPSGSWQARYDANQRRYNGILLFGIAFSVGSIIAAKASGLIYLNYYPPKSIE
ncbi:putative conserved insect protein [Operophtera brumata]|uniref:Putative conserved insect protein n=1 Tax=Operophtera brumata TaxID=104452 RepID=A0A0L7KZV1_OPEBR|nr:putative conserved insect protein [Operophtera brumata]